ncbi:MAG: multicopper oxidase domain-containing protein [bacterium]
MKTLSRISTLFLVSLGFACTGPSVETGPQYGKEYGAPPAQLGSTLPTESKYFQGNVALLPQVPEVDASPVKEVRLDVTHKVVELDKGVKFHGWTFGDDIPGPTIRVRQGDKVKFTLTNRSNETVQLVPPMPHSIDFHSAMVSPQDKYRSIDPGQTLSFEWTANYPGVFMYHCATPMVLQHLASGMYGMVIVDPKDGWPTKVDREYAVVQSEFFLQDKPGPDGIYEIDMDKVEMKHPTYVTFNGRVNRHLTEGLKAAPGERVRLYVLNAGPTDTSSFHVIGTIFDRVWLDGNPANEFRGLQTILLGASNGAVVEFPIPEAGKYVLVDHEFSDAHHGALGAIDATVGKAGAPAEAPPKPAPSAPEPAKPAPTPAAQAPAEAGTASAGLQDMPGAKLFKTKTCVTCHTIGQGKRIGPDLKGLFARRDEAWLRKYIPDATKATKEDPIAMQLKAEYKTQMPKLPLTDEELNQILAYLKEATK